MGKGERRPVRTALRICAATLAKDVTYTALTCDGFIVSSNVHAVATTVDTGFATSDHNPVLLTFTLE